MRRLLWVPVLAALIGLWQAYVSLGHVSSYVLPGPGGVARALYDNRTPLAHQAVVTGKEAVLGFLLAVAVGLAAAILLHGLPRLRLATYPVLVASQSLPVVAVAALLEVAFGFGLGPKLAIVALVCFFPVTVNAIDGFESVDPAYAAMMRTLHASRVAIFRRVEFPSALPAIFSGARVAASYAAVAALFAEYAGGESLTSPGLSASLRSAQFDTALIGAAVVVLAAIALALFAAVGLLERLVAPWGRRG